ncbi:hypothetical protein IQ235_10280 [Oscillatoriales cyanobacterium LEGE 11467]|uniref:Uncharacterized protein n=1 Tax=Zarconia navalis LEGE 11467 TaxID=1828826 RepID=A0A928VVM0_9CYAN|nr:hypothetical protein [Zarconia navalis]MBE9041164.1 hypothetical protein [Zarconia navalis LEGE 11467]
MSDAASANLAGDRPSRVPTWLIPGAIGLLAALGTIAMQLKQVPKVIDRETNFQQFAQLEEVHLQLLAQMPSLGFDNLIADWAFLRFLGYFGDAEAGARTAYGLNDDYFEAIVKRDPRFMEIYPFLSAAISIEQGNPELAGEYMERGIASLTPEINPRGFLILRYRSLDQLLLEGDIPGTIATYERMADWLDAISELDGARSFREDAEYLRQNPDSLLPRFWGWRYVWAQAIDERVRQRAESELLELGALKQEDGNGNVQFVLPQEGELLQQRSPDGSLP